MVVHACSLTGRPEILTSKARMWSSHSLPQSWLHCLKHKMFCCTFHWTDACIVSCRDLSFSCFELQLNWPRLYFIFFFPSLVLMLCSRFPWYFSNYYIFFCVRELLHILPYNSVSCFSGNSSAVWMMPFWTDNPISVNNLERAMPLELHWLQLCICDAILTVSYKLFFKVLWYKYTTTSFHLLYLIPRGSVLEKGFLLVSLLSSFESSVAIRWRIDVLQKVEACKLSVNLCLFLVRWNFLIGLKTNVSQYKPFFLMQLSGIYQPWRLVKIK